MKALMAVAATATVALAALAGPARSDCESVLDDMKDGIEVAAKNYEQSIEEIKGASDKAKARSHFCAITGEFLGTATAFRTLVRECVSRNEQQELIASLDKSIKDLQSAVDTACK
jgi:hypothetical protein